MSKKKKLTNKEIIEEAFKEEVVEQATEQEVADQEAVEEYTKTVYDALNNEEYVATTIGREMGWLDRLRHELEKAWTKFHRKFPRLVWYGQELDVRLTFIDYMALVTESAERVAIDEAQAALRRAGITFDTGTDFVTGFRDWEWDYSLRGPLSVTFVGKNKKPEERSAYAGATIGTTYRTEPEATSTLV